MPYLGLGLVGVALHRTVEQGCRIWEEEVGISSFLKRDPVWVPLPGGPVVSSSFLPEGLGSIPGRRTRISQVTRRSQKKVGDPVVLY